MVQRILQKTIYPEPKSIEYDRMDVLLPDVIRNTKRLCEYMAAQEVVLPDDALFAGQIKYDGSVPADIMTRSGHKSFEELIQHFYNQPIDNLATFEWQHCAAAFDVVIEQGIEGMLARIEKSREAHKDEPEKLLFLQACEMMCHGILAWEDKCAAACREKAQATQCPARKAELEEMAAVLDNVPRKPASSFREAVQSMYFTFDFLPDSLGTPDRYLYKWYKHDKQAGILTDDMAKDWLQESFIRIQSRTPLTSDRFYRGGESHFCIGGYTKEGEDGYNELSALLLEGLEELPLYCPQITLRWTPKTPREVLYHAMDLERKDPHKRIAFVSDVPRVKSFMANAGLTYEQAINYTMLGCNEPALQGGLNLGGCTTNIVRCLDRLLHEMQDEVLACDTYDAFHALFLRELYKDVDEMMAYSDKMNLARSKDENVLSSLFLNGCIENGVSLTRGGAMYFNTLATCGMMTLVDSLIVIKQFVYDEKSVTMQELLEALRANWQGCDELRTRIQKTAHFFGNNTEDANRVAQQFTADMYDYLKDKRNLFGCPYLLGNLIGYNQHNKFFGDLTRATPDGRYDHDMISFGLQQNAGRDREGLSALLASIAVFDPTGIYCGESITNVNLDEALVKNDDNFAKLVMLTEIYFKLGGLHVQFNCVSREDLLAAQSEPDKYRTLRVRVSGFSDFFNFLNKDLQDEIIERTEISR